MSGDEKVYTFTEAAELADVDPATLRHAVRNNKLVAFKEKGDWRITAEELERWINNKDAHKPGPKRKQNQASQSIASEEYTVYNTR